MSGDIITELSRGILRASDLRERLGVSPATLMRMVRDAGPDVLRIGRARATQYAWRQAWQHLDSSRFPVFRVTESGAAVSAGTLMTLAGRQSAWMPEGHVVDGLPIELMDAAPSGFLGRHFAAVHADLRLPPRLADWSDHHILLAMSRRGEDLPGNLIAGEESFTRWQALESAPERGTIIPHLRRRRSRGIHRLIGGWRAAEIRCAGRGAAQAREICRARNGRRPGGQALVRPLDSGRPRARDRRVARHGRGTYQRHRDGFALVSRKPAVRSRRGTWAGRCVESCGGS